MSARTGHVRANFLLFQAVILCHLVELDECLCYPVPPKLDFCLCSAATARIHPLFIDGLEIFDEGNQKVATISEISSPSELQLIQPDNVEVQNTVIHFRGDWQVSQTIEHFNITIPCLPL